MQMIKTSCPKCETAEWCRVLRGKSNISVAHNKFFFCSDAERSGS